MAQPVGTNINLDTSKTGSVDYNFKYFNEINNISSDNEIIILETKTDTTSVIKGNFRQRFLRNNHNIGLDWILFVIIGILFIFAWLRNSAAKYIYQIVNSTINYQVASKLYRDTTVFFRKISSIFNIIYVLVFSLLIFELIRYSNIVITLFDPMFLFPLILMSVSILLFVKLIIFRLLSFVFNIHREYEEGIFNILLFNKSIGIVLFPIVAIMPYSPVIFLLPLKLVGIGIIILMNVLKMIREIKIILSKDVLIFYLILYFCALEILPLLLIYKFVYSYIQ